MSYLITISWYNETPPRKCLASVTTEADAWLEAFRLGLHDLSDAVYEDEDERLAWAVRTALAEGEGHLEMSYDGDLPADRFLLWYGEGQEGTGIGRAHIMPADETGTRDWWTNKYDSRFLEVREYAPDPERLRELQDLTKQELAEMVMAYEATR